MLTLLWGDIRQHKLRLLVLAGCASLLWLLVAAVIWQGLAGQTLRASWSERFTGRFLIGHGSGNNRLSIDYRIPDETVDQLMHLPGVDPERSVPLLAADLRITPEGAAARVLGVEPGKETLALHSADRHLRLEGGSRPMLLGADHAQALGADAGDNVQVWGVEWHVAGVLRSAPHDRAMVIVPMAELRKLLHTTGASTVVLSGDIRADEVRQTAPQLSIYGPGGLFPSPWYITGWSPPGMLSTGLLSSLMALMALVGILGWTLTVEHLPRQGVLRALGAPAGVLAGPAIVQVAILCFGTTLPAVSMMMVGAQALGPGTAGLDPALPYAAVPFTFACATVVYGLAVVAPAWWLIGARPTTRPRFLATPRFPIIAGLGVMAFLLAIPVARFPFYDPEVGVKGTMVAVTARQPGTEFVPVTAPGHIERATLVDLLRLPAIDPTRSGGMLITGLDIGDGQVISLVGYDRELLAGEIGDQLAGTLRHESDLITGWLVARRLNLSAGDTVTLADTQWHVAGVLPPTPQHDTDFIGLRSAVHHFLNTSTPANAAYLRPAIGASPSDLAMGIHQRWPHLYARVETDDVFQSAVPVRRMQVEQLLFIGGLLVAIVLFTMAAHNLSAAARQREVTVYRLVGASRVFIWGRVIRTGWHDALLACVAGVLLGWIHWLLTAQWFVSLAASFVVLILMGMGGAVGSILPALEATRTPLIPKAE